MTSTHLTERSKRSTRTDGIARAARRWPAVAGAGLAVATGIGLVAAGEVAPVVTASGFVYLGAAALGRGWAAWPAFGASFVLIGLGRALPGFGPTWVMLGVAVALTAYGLLRGRAQPWWGLPLQAGALAVLAAVALVAAQASDPGAGLLVAGGLLAHAAWDVNHHRTRRVVARSMAEFCAVLDTVLAVLVLVATLA
ncbi:hypothetical protein [Pseudonocardia lacus]|uniref:hypothetical protein n=1 Tax=Pseudonocardia lacus TaxID=2835865 RepID=UPI001BDD739A|nr:hypothetical protein [Pseudonocardia lacus]